MTISTLCRISLVEEKRQIAEAGGIGLFATRLRISKGDLNLVRVAYKSLPLPAIEGEHYVSVREASNRTGLSQDKLRKLCRQGKIESKKDRRKWLILWKSLREYLEKTSK